MDASELGRRSPSVEIAFPLLWVEPRNGWRPIDRVTWSVGHGQREIYDDPEVVCETRNW